MERHRGGFGGGGRYGGTTNSEPHDHYSRPSTRGSAYSILQPTSSETFNHHRSPGSRSPISDNNNNYLAHGGGGGPHHRPFDSRPHSGSGGRGGEFRPIGGGGCGGGFSPNHLSMPMPPPGPLSGQKRGYTFSDRMESPTDQSAGGSFAKLFVGSVPRTATEEDIRPLFADHGNVLEVALIRDKRTGQQQGSLRDQGSNRKLKFRVS